MRKLMLGPWDDDRGSTLVTGEILFLFTILVIGVVSGLVALRQGMLSELTETAQALLALDQSFSFSGQANCESSTAGSSASDTANTFHEHGVGAGGAAINQSPCDPVRPEDSNAGLPPRVIDRTPLPVGPRTGREAGGGPPGNVTDRMPAPGVPRAPGGAGFVGGLGSGIIGGRPPAPGVPPIFGGAGFVGGAPGNGGDPPPAPGGPPAGGAGTGGGASGNGGGGTPVADGSQNPSQGGGGAAPKQPDGGGAGGQPPEKPPAPAPPKKSAILICVDGTGVTDDDQYAKEMANSFVHRIYLDSPIQNKTYHRGPDWWPAGSKYFKPSEVRTEVKQFLHDTKDQGAGPIFMTGYSRGAAIVINAAALLKKDGIEVEALFLFDCVDRSTILDSKTIPSNVKKCYHAIRDKKANSRTSFGNSGLEREKGQELNVVRYFLTTHGGMGGVPWGPEAVGKDGFIYENGDSWIGKLGKTDVTPAQDVKGSKEVEKWMWKFLREDGILR